MKSGSTSAAPGDTLTYTLSYTNKTGGTITSATGAQLRDVMPTSVTYVAASCTATCSVVGDTITWDLGTLAPGATGSKSYQVTVNSGLSFGSTFTNSATIRSAENDVNLADNDSSVTTTVGFNRAPVANPDSYSVGEDGTLNVVAAGVLANDTDADGNPLSVVATPRPVSGPSNGILTLNANGSFTYAPNANFNGSDSFTYKATDGSAQSSAATVSISVTAVNDQPLAVRRRNTIDGTEDTDKTVTKASLLANDSDVDAGGTLSLTAVSNPSGGTVEISGADVVFHPAANLCGTGVGSFDYTLSDGSLTDTGTVTVNLACVNDQPVAVDDTISGTEDTDRTVSKASLLANDSDVDGNTLSLTAVSNASGGSVEISGADVVFHPAATCAGPALAASTTRFPTAASATRARSASTCRASMISRP